MQTATAKADKLRNEQEERDRLVETIQSFDGGAEQDRLLRVPLYAKEIEVHGRIEVVAKAVSKQWPDMSVMVVFRGGKPMLKVEPGPLPKTETKEAFSVERVRSAVEEARERSSKSNLDARWPAPEVVRAFVTGFGLGIPEDYQSLKDKLARFESMSERMPHPMMRYGFPFM